MTKNDCTTRQREFVCIECGKKGIDTSPKQDKKFCGNVCHNAFHAKRRKKTVTTECLYNIGVDCANQQCERCGWNPEVEKIRKAKL